eukprot:6319869-Heterocapsa_arctica.AAC.1
MGGASLPACLRSSTIESIAPLSAWTFREIPADLMCPDEWLTVNMSKLRKPEFITRSEARGLSWSVRHQLRRAETHGKRLLFLGDNMCIILALGKRRCSSP